MNIIYYYYSIPGFHFYTLNLEKSIMQIIKELGIPNP